VVVYSLSIQFIYIVGLRFVASGEDEHSSGKHKSITCDNNCRMSGLW
jgi:hypothetical protein